MGQVAANCSSDNSSQLGKYCNSTVDHVRKSKKLQDDVNHWALLLPIADCRKYCNSTVDQVRKSKKLQDDVNPWALLLPIADCRKAGRGPPVDRFVQGRRVRASTTRDRAPLHVMMIVLVDMHAGPV